MSRLANVAKKAAYAANDMDTYRAIHALQARREQAGANAVAAVEARIAAADAAIQNHDADIQQIRDETNRLREATQNKHEEIKKRVDASNMLYLNLAALDQLSQQTVDLQVKDTQTKLAETIAALNAMKETRNDIERGRIDREEVGKALRATGAVLSQIQASLQTQQQGIAKLSDKITDLERGKLIGVLNTALPNEDRGGSGAVTQPRRLPAPANEDSIRTYLFGDGPEATQEVASASNLSNETRGLASAGINPMLAMEPAVLAPANGDPIGNNSSKDEPDPSKVTQPKVIRTSDFQTRPAAGAAPSQRKRTPK